MTIRNHSHDFFMISGRKVVYLVRKRRWSRTAYIPFHAVVTRNTRVILDPLPLNSEWLKCRLETSGIVNHIWRSSTPLKIGQQRKNNTWGRLIESAHMLAFDNRLSIEINTLRNPLIEKERTPGHSHNSRVLKQFHYLNKDTHTDKAPEYLH